MNRETRGVRRDQIPGDPARRPLAGATHVVGVERRRPQSPARVGRPRGEDRRRSSAYRGPAADDIDPGRSRVVPALGRRSASLTDRDNIGQLPHTHLVTVTPPSSSLAVACTTMPTCGCLWGRTAVQARLSQ